MARPANTLHPGVLIGLVVLTIVAAVCAMIAKTLSDDLAIAKLEEQKAIQAKEKAENQWIAERAQRFKEGRLIFGWKTEVDKDSKQTVEDVENWMIKRFPKEIESRSVSREEKVKNLLDRQVVVTDYENRPTEELEKRVAEIKKEYDDSKKSLEDEIARLKEEFATRVSEKDQEIIRRDTDLGNQAARIGELEQTIEANNSNHKTRVENLENRLLEVEFQKAQDIYALGQEIARLKVANEELRERIEQSAVDPNQQMTPDGEIINVASAIESGTAYINLGRKDRLSRGLRFEVFQYGHGGVQLRKGEVVVREVYEYTAKVGIVETVDVMDPIVVGDKIANAVFNPLRAYTFAIIGTFDNFTKEELKRLIEREGSKVTEQVQSGIDFVVVGKFDTSDFQDAENKRYQLAKDFHVQILNEDEIRKYLRDYSN